MKKLLIFSLLSMLALLFVPQGNVAYADDVQTEQAQAAPQDQQQETKVTLSQVYTDFKDALAAAGKALSVGAEHVYKVLVRQQQVKAIINIVVYTLCLGLGLPALWYGLKYGIEEETATALDIAPLIAGAVLVFVGGMHVIFTISDTITGFLNPEYGAFIDIKGFIRSY